MSTTFTVYHSKNRPLNLLFRPHSMAQLSSCSAVSLPLPLPTWPSWSALLSLSLCRMCCIGISITETQSAWSDLIWRERINRNLGISITTTFYRGAQIWKDKERVGQICSSSCGGTTGRFPKTDCYRTALVRDQVSVSGTENKQFATEMKWNEMKWDPLRCGDGMEWVKTHDVRWCGYVVRIGGL